MRMRALSPTRCGLCGLALGLAVFGSRLAHAAAVPGAELTLSRAPAAASCPDEAQIARELRANASARAESSEPLELHVQLDASGSAFTAQVRVSGRKQGERALRAEGPTCDALHDVLVVSLSLLLDDDGDGAPPESRPRATRATPVATPLTGWLTAGGAGTRGLPSAWSSAWYAGLALRLQRWDISLAALWAPERSVAFAPGEIAVQTLAARTQGCYALSGRELRVSGCATGMLATLRGQAEHFTVNGSERRTWLLLGLGPELRWFPTRGLSLGISGQLLASAGRPSFSIRGLQGTAYRTDALVGWLGADAAVRIW
jgi:hypothetical protein